MRILLTNGEGIVYHHLAEQPHMVWSVCNLVHQCQLLPAQPVRPTLPDSSGLSV